MLDVIHDRHEDAEFVLFERDLGVGEDLAQSLDLLTDLLGSLLFALVPFVSSAFFGGHFVHGFGDVGFFGAAASFGFRFGCRCQRQCDGFVCVGLDVDAGMVVGLEDGAAGEGLVGEALEVGMIEFAVVPSSRGRSGSMPGSVSTVAISRGGCRNGRTGFFFIHGQRCVTFSFDAGPRPRSFAPISISIATAISDSGADNGSSFHSPRRSRRGRYRYYSRNRGGRYDRRYCQMRSWSSRWCTGRSGCRMSRLLRMTRTRNSHADTGIAAHAADILQVDTAE